MTTKPKRQAHPVDEEGRIISLPDPPRNPDAMEQLPFISRINLTLDAYFRRLGRNDVLVNGEGYLCASTSDRSNLVVPDCVVALGVDPQAIAHRNGYVIDEVGQPPDLVLEVGSSKTGRRDYTIKPPIYAGYGIAEYWRFDPSGGNYHRVRLAGDRLVEGEYVPIELHTPEAGVTWGRSEVLGLDVYWDHGRVRFFDPRAGEFLPDYDEALAQRDAAEAEVRRLREELRRQAEG